MKRPVYVVDSFSDRPLAGNPAGVVLDGAELDAKQMLAIAAEMKHSETAFPLPAQDPKAALHLRWFTPTSEVLFCGHGTLAAFHVLVEEAGRIRVPAGKPVQTAFTCKSGLLHVELSRRPGGALKVLIETPASRFEPVQVGGGLLTALGLVAEVLDPSLAPARSASAAGNLYLAVRDREALARCRPDSGALDSLGKELGVGGFVVYTLAGKAGTDAALRCFFPSEGIVEDPVTGSAAGQLASLIQPARKTTQRRLVFTQGDELGRPGTIEIELRPDGEPGKVRGWIGGEARVVLRGELDLR
jgi:trans-2,3-dihydro-3-hydroxyanthranilate isomerase